ncbi:MAG: lipid-A-disaccharide synthase [Bacteroidota bacterium]|nr:lipid-A-disaccharide synthase [Bacteroidota bacterium]
MRYYIIAGEASGDLHASNLMKEIKVRDPEAEFRCWGGDRMQARGGEIVKHYRDLAFMGYIQVILNLRTIIGNLRFCKEDILQFNPDAVILVDYPGFNLRIAKFAHQQNLKVFYYISPQLWAWKKSRVKKIKKYVDRMFVILPFEKEFYQKYKIDVDFVGHPLLDAIPPRAESLSKADFIDQHKLDERQIIALLPGSRKQEIGTMLKVMLKMIPVFTDFQFVIAGESSIPTEFYNKIIGNSQVTVAYGQLADLLYNSKVALVTSGTATLETALIGTPEVVCYKAATFSYLIAKMIVDVKHISLVNLIMDREIVKELVQFDFTAKNLEKELDILLGKQDYRKQMMQNYADLNEKLGGHGASAKTAELMIQALGK